MQKTTPLRPHKVLGRQTDGHDVHALMLTTGPFSEIIFSYTSVNFREENDQLIVGYEYYIHEVPENKKGFDKKAFEQEIGDFVLELTYYGLERDKLGFIDGEQNRTDDPIESDSQ